MWITSTMGELWLQRDSAPLCENVQGIKRSSRRLPFRPWLYRAVPERGNLLWRPLRPEWMLGFEPYHHKARNDGQGSSRGQPVWTSGASFYERRHGHVASQPRGNPCGGRQVAITARSVFMTGASRLSCPLRASPRLWANRVDAKIGTVRSRACGPSGSLPQLPGGSPGAALVDVRTKLRQVADEVDGETVTRASAADLDDCQAGCSDQSGDPEQRYPDLDPVTAAALLCWMPELGSVGSLDRGGADGHGTRHIRGGRRRPRDLLFMAATSAARFNADLVRHKAHKVAIVAVMRKLWRTPCCDSSVAGRPKHR